MKHVKLFEEFNWWDEEIIPDKEKSNDVYDLKETILKIVKTRLKYEGNEHIVDPEIEKLINTIDRRYAERPSKEQLRIEIGRIISELREKVVVSGMIRDRLRENGY